MVSFKTFPQPVSAVNWLLDPEVSSDSGSVLLGAHLIRLSPCYVKIPQWFMCQGFIFFLCHVCMTVRNFLLNTFYFCRFTLSRDLFHLYSEICLNVLLKFLCQALNLNVMVLELWQPLGGHEDKMRSWGRGPQDGTTALRLRGRRPLVLSDRGSKKLQKQDGGCTPPRKRVLSGSRISLPHELKTSQPPEL